MLETTLPFDFTIKVLLVNTHSLKLSFTKNSKCEKVITSSSVGFGRKYRAPSTNGCSLLFFQEGNILTVLLGMADLGSRVFHAKERMLSSTFKPGSFSTCKVIPPCVGHPLGLRISCEWYKVTGLAGLTPKNPATLLTKPTDCNVKLPGFDS